MSAIFQPALERELRHTLLVTLDDVEWRDSGDPSRADETTLRGHAAVFNSLSEDLGGFRELLAPGAFRAALRKQPDVRLLINHEGLPLARTASGTLELREDGTGLHVFARLDKLDDDVRRLRGKMKRGDVDQMSFAFSVAEGGDDWATTEDGKAVRTIVPDGVNQLFDVSVVTFPAYEQTNVDMRSVLRHAVAAGKLPESLLDSEVIEQHAGDPAIAARGGVPESRECAGSGRLALEIARRKARMRIGQTPTPKE